MNDKARIGILGTGGVGQTLGTGFCGLGHEVRLGAREATNEKALAWAAESHGKGSVGTFADAAEFGELLVVATRWAGTENALRLAGPERFAGKVVMDVTNPIAAEASPKLAIGLTDSGGEQLQRWLPGAQVVKAFNTVGHAHMVKPNFPGGPPDMPICGDDPEARRTVAEICRAFGWSPLDLGGLEAARLLEPLCLFWILVGVRTGSWNHALKLLRR